MTTQPTRYDTRKSSNSKHHSPHSTPHHTTSVDSRLSNVECRSTQKNSELPTEHGLVTVVSTVESDAALISIWRS
ncbi:hypothetical protein V9T40_004747 [Parthenolecanium corni]|uniref:Uncharacterized protein n=1 Tax=Parthenolecanium corni TaxID=536013 RepID=A0AAN9TGK4_9HEMI